MMSSMGSSRGNTRSGGRSDKSSSSQKAAAHNATTKSTPTEPKQPVGKPATQEQLRFAHIISDDRAVDNEIVKEKVKKVHELTNRSEDEIMVALHDSNYDTEQAIILLLEREEGNQKDEWETISSKKSKVRGMAPSMRSTDSFNNHQDKDHKNEDDRRDRGGRGRNRDSRDGQDGRGDRGDRDGSYSRGRGRGGRGNLPPRMTRGRGRDRDNDYDRDRNDRNESGRGRGRRNAEMNGPSRRSNRGGGQRSFTNSKFGNYQEEDAFKSTDNVWRNPPTTESWDNAVNANTQQPTKTGEWVAEEWGAEDWTGDLAESQVFTASNPVPPMPLDPISASPSSQIQAPVGQPPSSGLSNNQGMPQPQSMDIQSSLSGPPGGMSSSGGLSSGGGMSNSGGMSAGGSRQPVGGSIGQSSAGNIGQPAGSIGQPTGSLGQHSGGMMQGMVGQPQGGMPGGMSTGSMSASSMSTGGMSSSGMSSGSMSAGSIGQPPGGMAVGGSVIGQGGMNANMPVNTTMPDMTRSIDLAALFGKSVQPPTTSLGVSDPASSGRDNSSVFSQFRDPNKTQNMNAMNEQQSKQVQMGMDQSQGGQLPPSSRAPTQSKPTRKKLPPPSTKIPASAVEMPNSARGLGALDVQFGAMDITMDPAVTDFGLSSSSMPSSMSSTLSTSGGLSNSAFSVNSPGTSANHMSYSKSNEPPYPASTGMSPVGMSSNTAANTPPSSVSQQSLDPSQQRGPPHYGQSAPQKQMTPEPIPLPNQNDMKTNTYLTSQKPSSVPSLESKDKTSSQLSQLASLSSTSGFGLSTSQSLGGNRQVPNSYGSPGMSGSSSIPTTSNSQYATTDLSSGGTSAFSTPMGSSSLSGSLSSGPSTIGYSSPSQAAGSLSSGGVLSSSAVSVGGGTGGTGSAGSSSLSSSGHLSSGMSASSSVSQATTTLSSSKLAGLDTRQGQSSLGSSNLVSGTLNSSSSSSVLSSASSSVLTSTSSLGYTTTAAGLAGSKTVSQGSAKLPPNLPPGMPFMYHPNLITPGFPLVNPIPTHQPYMYEDFPMQIGRLPMPFQQLATTTLNTGRDTNSLGNTPYSVTEASKFPRNDAASPVATSLSTQQHQQTAGTALAAGQGAHHQTQTQQQTPFLNTTLPPGYPGYSTLPYYAAGPGLMPPGLQYPAVFPAVSSVQPTNRAQTGTTPHSAFQQSGYTQPASHNAYGTGYDELTQTPDFSKGAYNSVSQSQTKGSGVTGRVTASVSSASTGPADLTGSSYSSKSHTQPFENKGGFHTGTPPPFNYPLTAVTQAGALNPAAAAGAAQQAHYAPFVPILPHHSAAMLAHQLPGDTQGAGSTGRSQGGATQSSKTSKPSYGTNYWGS